VLDMEIGTIVGRSFAAKGEVMPSELPAGRAAHFQLKGPFDGMPGAWQTLFAWCQAEKLERICTRCWPELGPLRLRHTRQPREAG
jgi:effector-binding domain-containing protein